MGIFNQFNNYVGMRVAEWQDRYVKPYQKGGGQYYMNYDKYSEYDVWYKGDIEVLAYFYQNYPQNSGYVNMRDNFFYANVIDKFRVAHNGLPSLISRTKARVLFNEPVMFEVNGDEAQTERLKEIRNDNKMVEQEKQGAITESVRGEFAYKVSFDDELTPYPIIEMEKEFKEIKKRGRTQEIVFFEWYEKNKKEYCLHETYGYGYVKYNLYVKNGDNMVGIPLATLEETAMLEDVTFNDSFIMAKVKHNINNESDYAGNISLFDALDEVESTQQDTVRKGKPYKYIPENLLQVSPTGAIVKPNEFETNVAVLGQDMSEGTHPKITVDNPKLNTDEYVNNKNNLVSTVLANVGLSKISVGLDDTDGANLSAASRREKEKATLRTRQEMVQSWEAFLSDFYAMVLMADDVNNNRTPGQYEVNVMFSEYIGETITDKSEVLKLMTALKLDGVVDEEYIIDNFLNVTEEEKARMLNDTLEDDINEEME